jgi:hypothetical protein
MKKVVNILIGVFVLSAGSVLAQSASVNSPHNYKRPISQQKVQSQSTLSVLPEERAVPLALKNNIASVHNYKRQGSARFEQEAVVVRATSPVGVAPQNPFLMPNYYKSQFRPTKVEQRMAKTTNSEKPAAMSDSLSK